MSKSPESLSERDNSVVLRPWSKPPGEPVFVEKASGCYVIDIHGQKFLDFTCGYFVNNAGHCHPKIIEAATAQMHKVMQVSGKHTTEALGNLAEAIVANTPDSIETCFFSCSGSEANESALKIARQKSGKKKIAYLEQGYHGLTLGSLSATASEKYRATAGIPITEYTYEIPHAYTYRKGEDCVDECLRRSEELFKANPDTAAFIFEPVQAVGGIAFPQAWWDGITELCDKYEILMIADEVQTGVGRTGTLFYVEQIGLQPAILTAGKGVSGGVGSLAATCTSWEVGGEFYSGTTPTSGGNAVSAAAGAALINVIFEEKLLENCRKAGEYFTEKTWALNDPWIGDVRFTGLLGGIELVADRESKEPLDKANMEKVRDTLHERGMLLTLSGPLGNCLRLQPPLSITTDDLDSFVSTLGEVLTALR